MVKRRMLDLCCGSFAIGKEFAARGWEVVGIDIVRPAVIPEGCTFIQEDIFKLRWLHEINFYLESEWEPYVEIGAFDFGWASTPCENFSIHRMKMFHPNPPYPELGIRLFNHARGVYESSGIPYVMENVKTAEQFIGRAINHAGSFYLWGNSVPAIIPRGLTKGMKMDRKWCQELGGHGSSKRDAQTAGFATIPPELASCVADYAERITECVA